MDEVINLLQLYKDWYRHCAPGDAKRELADDDINLGLLKAKTRRFRWTAVKYRPRTLKRTVQINKGKPTDDGDDDDEAVGHVHSGKICENRATVRINQGVIRGLNTFLKLPLRGCKNGFVENFGPHLKIDTSKPFSDVTGDKLNVEIAMEQTLGQGDKVLIRTISHEYNASFKCKVVVTGSVPNRSGLEQTLAGMLQDLRDKHLYNSEEDLERLKMDGKDVVLKMVGEVELRWEDCIKYNWEKDN